MCAWPTAPGTGDAGGPLGRGPRDAIQEVAVRGSLVANEVARRALLAGMPWDSDSFPKVGEQSWWRNIFSSCCQSSRTKDGPITRSRDALFGTDVFVRADMYLRANMLSSLARDAVTNARLHVQDYFMLQLRKESPCMKQRILAKGVRGKLVERAVRHAFSPLPSARRAGGCTRDAHIKITRSRQHLTPALLQRICARLGCDQGSASWSADAMDLLLATPHRELRVAPGRSPGWQ